MLSSGRIAFLALLLLFLAVAGGGCGGSDSSASEGGEGSTEDLQITWQKPASRSDQIGYETLKASEAELLAKTLLQTYELPDSLTVNGVNGSGQGPSYEAGENLLTLPYGFAALIFETVSGSSGSASKSELSERVAAVSDLIIEHELGHALIANLGLTVPAGEEDAADEIAAILLLEQKAGAKYAADASIFFANFSDAQEPADLKDYVEAHGLDLDHALDILCWAAGSSKRSLEEVAEIGAIGGAEQCPEEFDQLSEHVTAELEPHLR